MNSLTGKLLGRRGRRGHRAAVRLQLLDPVQPEVPQALGGVAVGLEIPGVVQRVEPQRVHVAFGDGVPLRREVLEPQLRAGPGWLRGPSPGSPSSAGPTSGPDSDAAFSPSSPAAAMQLERHGLQGAALGELRAGR